MLDPKQFAQLMEVTSTGSHGGPVDPIPTIVPTPTDYEVATKTGFTTLWVVFVILAIASAVFTGLSWKIPVSRRVYHVITTLVTIIAALSYFALATGQGKSLHCGKATDHHKRLPDTHHEVCRPVYWARYVEWLLVTPLLIFELSLLAGISGAHTLIAIAADLTVVVASLFAAFGRAHTGQKWGWFAISGIAYLVIIWQIGVNGFRTSKAKGGKGPKLFSTLAIFSLVVWTAYPIVWAIAGGTHKVTVDTEIIAYAILDILGKVVFGFLLLSGIRRAPETSVDVGGYWSNGVSSDGRIRIGEDEEA